MDPKLITRVLRQHYGQKFAQYGATTRGVDWGDRENEAMIRYDNMLSVIRDKHAEAKSPSLLDVGCGYGGLLERADKMGRTLNYCGIDVCESMIEEGRRRHPNAHFQCTDFFEYVPAERYDYVVCNGILTQKLNTAICDMDEFAQELIRKMFAICQNGIAFNVMTSRVNFMVENLYYRSPVELFAWCFSEITSHVRLDHSYPLYEYTLYLYKDAE